MGKIEDFFTIEKTRCQNMVESCEQCAYSLCCAYKGKRIPYYSKEDTIKTIPIIQKDSISP